MPGRVLPLLFAFALFVGLAWYLWNQVPAPPVAPADAEQPKQSTPVTQKGDAPKRQRTGAKAPEPATDYPPAMLRDPGFRSGLAGFRARLVDPDGNPLAGLKVWCQVRDQPVRPWTRAEATSGGDGRFVIQGLWPSSETTVRAGEGSDWFFQFPPGKTYWNDRFVLHPGQIHDAGDFVMGRCGAVTGLVKSPHGEPLAGALVEITEGLPRTGHHAVPTSVGHVVIRTLSRGAARMVDGGRDLWRRRVILATTDAEGRFRAEGVRIGDLEVTAQLRGRYLPVRRAARSKGAESDLGEFRFAGATITVRVVDHEKQPVRDAELAVNHVLASTQPNDGRFVIGGVRGGLKLAARRPGGPWVSDNYEFEAGGEYVFELPELIDVRYRVLDPNGTVVTDAEVTLHPSRTDAERMEGVQPTGPDPVPVRPESLADGVFVVRGLPARSYSLRAVRRGAAGAVWRSGNYFNLKKRPKVVDLQLGREFDVRVVAVDEAGQPVPYAKVTVGGRQRGYTDEQGELVTTIYSRELVWTFKVTHPRYDRFFKETSVETGVVRAIMKRELAIVGKVHFRHGRPDDLSSWYLMLKAGDDWEHPNGHLRPDGSFVIRPLEAGEYTLDALFDGTRTIEYRLRKPAAKTFTLRDADQHVELETDWRPPKSYGRIHGRLLLNGKPAVGATIDVSGAAVQDTCKVSADGSFAIGPLLRDPVRFEIKYEFSGDGIARLWAGFVEMSQLGGDPLALNFHTGTARGTVFDADGKTGNTGRVVSRAMIDVPRLGLGVTWCSVPTDKQGRYVLPVLVEGTHRFDAWKGRGAESWGGLSPPVTVTRGAELRGFDVRLRRVVTVQGTLDFSGIGFVPSQTTEVSLRFVTSTREAWGDRHEKGRFEVERLLPGRYRAVLLFEDHAQGNGALRLVHQKPIEIGDTDVRGMVLRFGKDLVEQWRAEAKKRGAASLESFVKRYGLAPAK